MTCRADFGWISGQCIEYRGGVMKIINQFNCILISQNIMLCCLPSIGIKIFKWYIYTPYEGIYIPFAVNSNSDCRLLETTWVRVSIVIGNCKLYRLLASPVCFWATPSWSTINACILSSGVLFKICSITLHFDM